MHLNKKPCNVYLVLETCADKGYVLTKCVYRKQNCASRQEAMQCIPQSCSQVIHFKKRLCREQNGECKSVCSDKCYLFTGESAFHGSLCGNFLSIIVHTIIIKLVPKALIYSHLNSFSISRITQFRSVHGHLNTDNEVFCT